MWKWVRRHPGRAAAVAAAVIAMIGLGAAWNVHLARVRETEQVTRANGLVRSLGMAETAAVPHLVEELAPVRSWAEPMLREMAAGPAGDRATLHARLALLPTDPSQASPLADQLLIAQPDELLVLRTALFPYREQLVPRFWDVALSSTASQGSRLRAACALAAYAPEDPKWAEAGPSVARDLVGENPLTAVPFIDALHPVRQSLIPTIEALCTDRGRSESDRLLATRLAARYAEDMPEVLARLMANADPESFAILLPVASRIAGVADALVPFLDTAAGPGPRANASAGLFHLGRAAPVWDLLRHRPDPTARTALIHRLAPLRVPPRALMERVGAESDVGVRQALLLALGEYEPAQIPAADRAAFGDRLLRLFRDDPNPGVHASVDWLLRQRWGRAADLDRIDRELRGQPARKKRWWVDSEGFTLSVQLESAEFRMGSPPGEPSRLSHEPAHRRRIPRSFAIATRETSVRQFERFLAAHPKLGHAYIREHSPSPDGPIIAVTWFHAAAYCRWLSEQEGLPESEMCYPPVKEIREGMPLPANLLTRTGYRLPTEAEWEYACRAGATTRWSHGEDENLLGRYAWHMRVSDRFAWPCGRLKPNDFGLFDIHGNVLEWCHGQNDLYPTTPGPAIDYSPREVDGNRMWIARGGSIETHPSFARSACRHWYSPSARVNSIGFRVARTCP